MSFNNTSTAFDGTCFSVRCVFSLLENCIIATAFFAVIIVSLTGNIAICYMVLTKKLLRGIANLSTLNLALSDLLITIVCAPVITVDIHIAKRWIFGELFCKIVPVIQKISVNASVINLFVISLEKFMAVYFPFIFRSRKRSFAYGMPMVWLIAIAVAAPSAKYRKLITTPKSSYCVPDFPDIKIDRVFAFINTLSFFVPSIIMACLQLTTIYSLGKKGVTGSLPYLSQRNIRRRRAAVVIFIVMLSFLACWTPIYIVSMLNKFSKVLHSMKMQTLNIMYVLLTWLFYACAAIHPIIYFFMTPQGRTLSKQLGGTKGRKESKLKLLHRPLRPNSPSTAGSNLESILSSRESRV